MELITDWIARLLLLAIGVWAVREGVRWVGGAWSEERERWTVRVALGMGMLCVVYAVGHGWLLANRQAIEEGRAAYTRWGDPRLAEARRAEIRGWILDRTGTDEAALVAYERQEEHPVVRSYPIGEAGANLIGAAEGGRDFVVERLYADALRTPASWSERGQPHPAGADLRLTLHAELTREAWRLLQATGRPGVIVVQDASGAVLTYTASGGLEDAPLGIRQYAPPGSVFKLPFAALWWESGLGDPTMACPGTIEVGGRTIQNYGGVAIGPIGGAHDMLVYSCNTAAVWMAQRLREEIGEAAFIDAFRAYGFLPYAGDPPAATDTAFWATTSDAWQRRMSPSASRLRMTAETHPFDWALLSIGQGAVDVTVVQISRFLQAVAADGVMHRATLEWSLEREGGEGNRIMAAETAARLRASMEDVVRRGTARSTIPVMAGTGWWFGGKTGTAQITGAADDGWFAGLTGPGDRPRYTVVVYLRGGGPGGAGPANAAAQLAAWMSRNLGETE